MDWQEIHRRLLASLREEAQKQWGRIAEIEKGLGISDGYLAKLCQGKSTFKLPLFLKAIQNLDLDPRAFFSRALEIQPATEDYLRQLDDPTDRDLAFDRIARATRELESAEPTAQHKTATAGADDVPEIAANPRREQMRRLRSTHKYRTHAFARAYLEHLDSLRYDHAEEAAILAARVAGDLIPALPGPQSDRLALQCFALGVFGSARRLKGKLSAASRAFQLALEVSRRARLREDSAKLLQRASYLLKDCGQFNRALDFLNEALVFFVQLGSDWGMGRVLIDQGMMRSALGDYEGAVLDLKQALVHLKGSATQLGRSHLAAYQYLAYAYEQLGELDKAHRCLSEGVMAFRPQLAVDAAKLQWIAGTLAFKNQDYARAEEQLGAASSVLAAKENPGQQALVSLDLVSVMLAQGRNLEASELAKNMAPLLFSFKSSRLAEAAILELINTALEGQLGEDTVEKARQALLKGRNSGRASRPVP